MNLYSLSGPADILQQKEHQYGALNVCKNNEPLKAIYFAVSTRIPLVLQYSAIILFNYYVVRYPRC
ncbi:MAG: hypothetical protein UZ06_CHB003000137 [Chlorobi bacterium OLB6]|nr:MAG: hypothetical protein UZ06_CHB003000137 [Chlorobi bacterium OLB6]